MEREYTESLAKLEQYQRKSQRLENRVKYYLQGERKKRTHRLITRGAAVESVAPEVRDRAALWNAVEKAERGKKAQLAYSFDIALQNEFSLEENIALARQFISE